jgi:hypothetical protein
MPLTLRLARLSRLAALLSAALAFSAPVAFAQDIAAAEALFREGRALMDQGDYVAACQKLTESQRLDASSGTLLNLAVCHAKQGKTATAWAEFLAAARLARTQGNAVREDEARKRAAELEPQLSYLTIVVSQPLAGLVILRNDVRLEATTLGSKIPVDPGEHTLAISAPGYQPLTMTVTIGQQRDERTLTVPALEKTAGAPVREKVAPPRAGTGATKRSAPATTIRPGPPTAAYVIGGTGVVLTAAGAVFGVMAMSSHSNAESLCPTRRNCSSEAVDERDEAGVRANIANAGLGLGLVGIGVGAVLLMTSSSGPEGDRASPRRPGIEVAPVAGSRRGGLTIAGAF